MSNVYKKLSCDDLFGTASFGGGGGGGGGGGSSIRQTGDSYNNTNFQNNHSVDGKAVVGAMVGGSRFGGLGGSLALGVGAGIATHTSTPNPNYDPDQ